MPDGKPDRPAQDGARARWAAVNLVAALLLILVVGAVRLRAQLSSSAGIWLLVALGLVALVSAAVLLRSFLRR